jgi:hypothetical protein
VSADEQPRVIDVPVSLRLDRPASDVLSAELIPPPEPAEGQPAPTSLPSLRVANPVPYPVTVGRVIPNLLIIDETLPTPIGAVAATAVPSTFKLGPAEGDVPSTVELALTPNRTDLPPLYGSVGVAFVDIDIDIVAEKVLAKAHDTGASGDVASTIYVRCYQLEHPEVLPAELSDVFGLELQMRRTEDAEPITVFLTRDQPSTTVQVGFTLRDILAGAKPEQPKFKWRRRNMAGSGTGEWSDWDSIIGRQLLVAPNGV